jgi:hypothetical protein
MTTALQTTTPPVQWDAELRGAQYLLKSGLVPADIKTPEAAMFIILAGRDLGMSPVQSLRSIRVIKGKVEVAADAQLGKFHTSGGRSRFLTLTNDAAKLELSAPWLTAPHVETFTIEDARLAQLGGDNWKKYPKAMLRSRAITAGLKSIGFDATAGVYAPGEIGGEVQVIGDEVVAVEVQTTTTDTSEALTLPGKPESWGGHGGMPLADLSDKVLTAFVKWADTDDRREKYDAHLSEARGVMARRAAESEEVVDAEEVAA